MYSDLMETTGLYQCNHIQRNLQYSFFVVFITRENITLLSSFGGIKCQNYHDCCGLFIL